MFKTTCLLSGLMSAALVFAHAYGSTIAERGGDAAHSNYQGEQIQNHNYGNYGNYGYEGGYGGYEGGVPVVTPVYPAGGYLLPGPVDPGQDEADAIYRANQHSGE